MNGTFPSADQYLSSRMTRIDKSGFLRRSDFVIMAECTELFCKHAFQWETDTNHSPKRLRYIQKTLVIHLRVSKAAYFLALFILSDSTCGINHLRGTPFVLYRRHFTVEFLVGEKLEHLKRSHLALEADDLIPAEVMLNIYGKEREHQVCVAVGRLTSSFEEDERSRIRAYGG